MCFCVFILFACFFSIVCFFVFFLFVCLNLSLLYLFNSLFIYLFAGIIVWLSVDFCDRSFVFSLRIVCKVIFVFCFRYVSLSVGLLIC